MLRYFGVIAPKQAGSRGPFVRIGMTDYKLLKTFREAVRPGMTKFVDFCAALRYKDCPASLRDWAATVNETKPAAPGFSPEGYHAAWVERCCKLLAVSSAKKDFFPARTRGSTIAELCAVSVDMSEHIAHMFPQGESSARTAMRALGYDGDPLLWSMWTCLLSCREACQLNLHFLQELASLRPPPPGKMLDFQNPKR